MGSCQGLGRGRLASRGIWGTSRWSRTRPGLEVVWERLWRLMMGSKDYIQICLEEGGWGEGCFRGK